MGKRRFITLALVAACGAAAAGTLAARRFGVRPEPPARDQSLVVQDGHSSFGNVWESRDFRWSFPVVNCGEKALVVDKVVGSCTCLSVEPARFTIPPRGTQVVTARIDFTAKARTGERAAFALRYQAADETGGGREEGRWIISGNVRPFLVLDGPLDFGRRSLASQPLGTIKAVATFGAAVEDVRVTSLGAGLRFDYKQLSDGRYELILATTGAFAAGPLDSDLNLEVTLAAGGERAERLRVTGYIAPDVAAAPPAFPAGGRTVGETFDFDLALSSLSVKPFSVVAVRAVGDGLSVEGGGGVYTARQRCLAGGDYRGRVEFDVEAADGFYTVRVPVDYTGFAP